MPKIIDVTSEMEADRTTWAVDEERRVVVLVLHDASGKPFATASYTPEDWEHTFRNYRLATEFV